MSSSFILWAFESSFYFSTHFVRKFAAAAAAAAFAAAASRAARVSEQPFSREFAPLNG